MLRLPIKKEKKNPKLIFSSKTKFERNEKFFILPLIIIGILLTILTTILLIFELTDRNKCIKNDDSKFSENCDASEIKKLKMLNQEYHSIPFDFCQSNLCKGQKYVTSFKEYEIEFCSTNSTIWKCKAWINGLSKDPLEFVAWNGTENFENVKYMIRNNNNKDVGIWKSNYDGSNEEKFINLVVTGK